MNLTESIRIAVRALGANKLRASLTMLGIMIGVAAVITLVSLGDGVTRFVADQFIGLGTNLVFILPQDDPQRVESTLTTQDAARLADPRLVPEAIAVAPILYLNRDIQYKGNIHRTMLRATTPDFMKMRGLQLAEGRGMTDLDYNGRGRVAILGADVVEAIYPQDIDPLGTDIKVGGITFRVIGILAREGGSAFGSQDDIVIVPMTTAHERLTGRRNRHGQPIVDVILLQAVNNEGVNNLVVDASEAMRQSHGITFRDEDDFLLLTQQDFLGAFASVTRVLTLFLGAIAFVSLIVGGIGIMNIMLVSVTERTREIGLRKAVGARHRDILAQFLTEAVVLSLLGGLTGIALGFLGSRAIHLAVPDLDTAVTAGSIMLAVGFSVGVGLFFGIYPAYRAAMLHPIEALRFE